MRPVEEIRADLADCDRDGVPWPSAARRVLADVPALLDCLEAVRALADEWERAAGPESKAWAVYGPQNVSVPFAVEKIRAALSVTPQPEPEDGCAECTESGTRNCVAGCKPEPPASAEPVPDLMQALRASLEAAKQRRTGGDEPARCEHGQTKAHNWNVHRFPPDRCPGPAASGTPEATR